MAEDDFIVHKERNKFYAQSKLFTKAFAMQSFLSDIHNCKIIAAHVLECDVCMYHGINECNIFKNLDGVYDNPDFMLR